MGLETGTFVNDLVATNPIATDPKSVGDDHLRLLKTVLRNTFPNATKALYFPNTYTKTASFGVVAADQNSLFLVNTTSGVVNATLNTLTAADAGFEAHFIKTNTGSNPIMFFPGAGTLQSGEYSGLTSSRRCIPGRKCTALWTGTGWILTRNVGGPLNTLIPFAGVSLPVGFEWPNGQTLVSASTYYPDFYAANGNSGVVIDKRGRVGIGKDDMGGSAAGRITNAKSGIVGTTLLAAGGNEENVLTIPQLPIHSHAGTTDGRNANHKHDAETRANYITAQSGGGVNQIWQGTAQQETGNDKTDHAHAYQAVNAGGGLGHANVQPSIIMNELLVVE